MKKIYLTILFFIFTTFSLTVHAEQGTEKSLDAIVEIRISVPANRPHSRKIWDKSGGKWRCYR